MKRSRVGATIHWGRLVLLFITVALVVGTGISDVVSHEYGQGAGLIAAGLFIAVPTALMRWYPQAFSFGPVERPNPES